MIVKNIKCKCAEKGISLAELERLLGIGNGVIAKWSGSFPRVDNLKKVADFFCCTVDDLMKE